MNKFLRPILSLSLITLFSACEISTKEKINRQELVERNNPNITEFEELSSLSVGNGNFAYTVDATGLQTYPELYANGVPLGTQSQWAWHSFPNIDNYKHKETLKAYNLNGNDKLYAVQFSEQGRQRNAANFFRENPHRLHLGYIGLELSKSDGSKVKVNEIKSINQTLNLWNGTINSSFNINDINVKVQTVANPNQDKIAVKLNSELITKKQMSLNFRFPYPTGAHADDATDWNSPKKHKTELLSEKANEFILKRSLDSSTYYLTVKYTGRAKLSKKEAHYFVLTPEDSNFTFTCEFTPEIPQVVENISDETFQKSSQYWINFWEKGGAIDFANCTDERAVELERRIILSQYLMAIQSAGMYPPQETGLTYNSWYGKFHLEMHWWHAVHFALWNRTDLLERSMDWYAQAYPIAKDIAERQGYKGVRWMKMTDPSAMEAPSKVGSFLIWQQPHFIYMAELIYRNNPNIETINKYAFLINETAEFMASFATYDMLEGRYVLQGVIPAQETLRASETINPPFELSYWHYALSVAQKWREREGKKRKPQWDEIIDKLSPLTALDGLYLASEDALDTYKDIRFTSDHPAVLGSLGMLPKCQLVREDYMKNTLSWIWDNWNWGKTWGWDYPMTAMCAARLGKPEKAVDALLMEKRTNTYLINGHNYQDSRLRVYLPGNGGLLTAVAMMCAGWDGNKTNTPGFPKNGKWNVCWEGLQPMP